MRGYERYFDDEGKQVRALPKKWLDLSRFKVGGKVRYLDPTRTVHIPCADCRAKSYYHYNGFAGECEVRRLVGMVGVIEKVNHGDARFFPPRFYDDGGSDGGIWLTQRQGWLTVRFEVTPYTDSEGNYQPMALHASEEGDSWEAL